MDSPWTCIQCEAAMSYRCKYDGDMPKGWLHIEDDATHNYVCSIRCARAFLDAMEAAQAGDAIDPHLSARGTDDRPRAIDTPDPSAVLPAPLPRDGWRPIAEAPKDGTQVLLWWPYWAKFPVVGYWSKREHWDSVMVPADESNELPTHFQPLPDPPSSQRSE